MTADPSTPRSGSWRMGAEGRDGVSSTPRSGGEVSRASARDGGGVLFIDAPNR